MPRCRNLYTAGTAASAERHAMVIGILTVEYTLHGNDSLKGKRRVASSLKAKVRAKFNVSIAEIANQDSLTRLSLAVVTVSNSEKHLQSRLTKCLSMMEAACPEEMTYSDMEFFGAE
ncbi:protein of unknown function DUF503 [Oleidesulfovibrio alaskensis G20]|jgi:uncharacterized protein YlxP (DUF503 family)|uniref:YlxP-like protein n=2 Tax=Oleidesulfovibrio alaskensis TaxID=58180 RepID=Q30WI9_OLEA2|nr:protein of unknown function DUF503 [Oleidesulfovibrio alaskensis G20]